MRITTYRKHIRFLFGLLVFMTASLVCATAKSLPRSASEPPSQVTDIPLRYDPILCPRILVQVSINKAVPMSFLVDTGSNVSLVIDKWAAEQLGLKLTGEKFKTDRGVIMDATNLQNFRLLTSETDTSAGIDLPVNQAVITDMHYPADLVPGTRIAGIIGLPILQYHHPAIRFDLAAHKLTLYTQDPPPAQGADTATLPLKEVDNQYFVKAEGGKGSPVDMMIDTGAETVFVPVTQINHFALDPTPAVYEERMFMEGTWHFQVSQAAHFALGTLIEPDVVVRVSSRKTALLGMPMLARFRFTMDFLRKQLLLERAADYAAQIRLPGAAAIDIERSKETIRVESVVKDTTAERAGIQSGDEVVEIDHVAVKTLPLSVAQNMLNGFANTTASITLRRDGKVKEVTFLRQSLFAFASGTAVGIGIGVDIDANGRMLVMSVTTNSPAAEAGIQAGDEILEVNGLVVGKASFTDIGKQTNQPEGSPVVLKLQRTGESKPREVTLKIRKLL